MSGKTGVRPQIGVNLTIFRPSCAREKADTMALYWRPESGRDWAFTTLHPTYLHLCSAFVILWLGNQAPHCPHGMSQPITQMSLQPGPVY